MTRPEESPEYDAELSRRLSWLADDASDYTNSHGRPLPAESVRRLGTQRRHRRVGGVAVATLACVVMAGGVAIGATREQGDQPPATSQSAAASASPSSAAPASPSSAAPSGPRPSSSVSSSPSSPSAPTPPRTSQGRGSGDPIVDPDLLPVPGELAWHDFGDYRTVGTSQGQGDLPADACVQPMGDLGANGIARRDFQGVIERKNSDVQVTSWVLRFDSARQTDAALETLRGWGTACSGAGVHPVGVSRGSAEFYDHTLKPGADADFAMYGITRAGEVIAIVLLTSVGQDSNWAYDVTDTAGLALHPLIRSLPLVNARLAGTRGKLASTSDPVKACTGGQDGIDVSTTPVKGSAGAGHVSYRIRVTNTMKVACTIQGYPGVQLADDLGEKVGTDAARTGPTGPTLRLQPGTATTAIIRLSQAGAYGDPCDATDASSFRIFLPGMKEPSFSTART